MRTALPKTTELILTIDTLKHGQNAGTDGLSVELFIVVSTDSVEVLFLIIGKS